MLQLSTAGRGEYVASEDTQLARRVYKIVGTRVRDARSEARMTQEGLAEILGVTRSSIANLEAGRQGIPVHRLIHIAHALNVSVSILVRDDDFSAETLLEATDVDDKLAVIDESSRDFVSGALSQLYADPSRDSQ
jgi:transcriptional regulator with XRE-family HTH domain